MSQDNNLSSSGIPFAAMGTGSTIGVAKKKCEWVAPVMFMPDCYPAYHADARRIMIIPFHPKDKQ